MFSQVGCLTMTMSTREGTLVHRCVMLVVCVVDGVVDV